MQDIWDSIQNNEYFSVEGAKDIIKQVRDAQVTLFCFTDYQNMRHVQFVADELAMEYLLVELLDILCVFNYLTINIRIAKAVLIAQKAIVLGVYKCSIAVVSFLVVLLIVVYGHVVDVQMQYFKQPDLETPKYKVLKRTSVYQVTQAPKISRDDQLDMKCCISISVVGFWVDLVSQISLHAI